MNSEKFTHDVVVHKANIALAKGESIQKYVQALSEAGRKYVMQKLNLVQKSGSVYMVEAFSESAVFSVYKYSSDGSDVNQDLYFATKYTRKSDNFVFGELLEVERVTNFKVKSSLSVTKANTSALVDASGWSPATKNLWSGLL